jgi:hypothetical protein
MWLVVADDDEWFVCMCVCVRIFFPLVCLLVGSD